MKDYTRIYLKEFGYEKVDFIPCEICGARAVDIHHIEARSIAKAKEKEPSNLMALCRKHHVEFGDKKQHKAMLVQKHAEFMQSRQG